jgi:uncharacterized protein (DUF2141 family)
MVAFAAVLLTAVVAQSVPAAPPQNAPPPTGLIVGRVLDGSTNRPIAGAVVSLNGGAIGVAGPARSTPRALTSSTGQFVFRRVPKGSYALRAARAGYADGMYGQRRPGGVSGSLKLDDAQRVGDAVILIWKHATIAGTVVDEAGEPLIGVQVRAFQRRFAAGRARLTQAGTTMTDDRGFYRFASLVPGEYLVAFVWREASVPTSVAELFNNPAILNDPKMSDLMRERMTVGPSFSGPGSSNAVQVGGLQRDLGFAAPVPPQGDGPIYIYPTQFYPGVPAAARARAVTLASGESRDGIDFSLRPVRTARVSGTVLGPDGPVPNIAVRLVPATDEMQTELETSVTMTGSGGEFTLLGVPAGQYLLKVLRQPRPNTPQNNAPVMTQIQIGSSMMISSSGGVGTTTPAPITDDPTLSADAPIAVGETDVHDVLVSLQRAPRLTGHFEFDGNAPKPDAAALMRINVSVARADGVSSGSVFIAGPFGHADESGQFKTYGIPPGRYVLRTSTPEHWTFRSATVNGQDIADVPFDVRTADINDVVVTFTDRPTNLNGTVRAATGAADGAALVVIFPAENGNWAEAGMNPRRLRSTRTDRTGSFTMNAMPPGDYYVVAVHEDAMPQWQDPQALQELAGVATQLHLAEGETKSVTLKTSGGGL